MYDAMGNFYGVTQMQIKLIACDMDDTLLNGDIEISERNFKAIKKARDAGIVFLIATGRMYVSAQPYALKLRLDTPIVAYNGALVRGSRSGKVFYEHKMKIATAQEVLDYCREMNYYTQFYAGDKLLIEKCNDFSDFYTKISGIPATEIGDELYKAKEEPYKILIMTEIEKFSAAWKNFEEKFAGKLDVTSSKEGFLELMEPGVNKWEAIKAVAAGFNINPSEIMCIGDSNNDIPMIKNAGIGVAMGNAQDEVKKNAKIVTASNNDDGVALVIESILTKQEKVDLG